MSDDTPAHPDDAERRHAERRRGEQQRVGRALLQGALALLVAVVAVILAVLCGYRVLALERALDAERDAGRLAGRDREIVQAEIGRLEARAAADASALARNVLLDMDFNFHLPDGRVWLVDESSSR